MDSRITMSRSVIPPLPLPKSSSLLHTQQLNEVLRRRIATAEGNTERILKELNDLGYSNPKVAEPLFQDLEASNTLIEKEIKECAECSNPERPQSESSLVEPRPSSFTQEGLISRVCKLESIIQTLRLGLAGSGSNSACTDSNGSGNRGRSQWKQPELDDKLSQVQQELGTEVARLKRHLVALQEELSLESQARQRAKEEIDQLKEALEEAVQARVSFDGFLILN